MTDGTPASRTLYTRQFLGVVSVNFLSFSQWFSLNPVMPLLIIQLGGDAAVAGLAFAVFSIPSLIFRPIFGGLSDRFGTRLILLGSTLAIGLAAPLYLVPSLAFLMIVRVVHGIAWAAVMTAAPALMARLVPVTRRGEAASVWDLMPSLAQLIMPAVGLLLWTAGGPVPVLVLGLALGLGGWLAMMLSIRHDDPTARPAATSSGRMLILEPSAVLPMIIAVLFMSASPLFVIYPPILATRNDIPLTELAIYYPVFGLAMVGSRIVIRKMIDRLPRVGVIVAGGLLAIAALFGSIGATSILALTVAGALYGGAIGVLVPAMTATVMDRAPADRIGSAMGTYTIGFQFAGGFGAALWGLVIEQSGFVAAYAIAIGVQVVLLAVALSTRRELAQRPARIIARQAASVGPPTAS